MTSHVDQPSEARLLKAAVEAGIARVHTSLPGIVVSYDETARTAIVQPAVYDSAEPHRPIEDVPVLFPRGGGYRLVWPLAKGDEVELHFSKSDPSRFQVSGEVSPVNYVRKSGLYATATPGASSDPKQATATAVAGALCIGSEDGVTEIVITSSGLKLGSNNAADYVALASKVDQQLASLKSAIAGASTTSNDGGAAFKAAILAALSSWPQPVGSTKVGCE